MSQPTRCLAAAAGSALLALALPASAVAVDALPYGTPANDPATNSPAWTVIVFSGTSMTAAGGQSTLTTAPNRGVWFGNGSNYGDTPSWSNGTAASGNQLSLDLQFSAGARDWSAYLYDRTHIAAFSFAPTGCDGNAESCYDADDAPYAGVSVAHAAGGNAAAYAETFVPLNLSQPHRFEWLLKNGQVSYRIDGQVVYSGAAYASAPGGWIGSGGFLLIGDGSGSTRTGVGSMTITGLRVDTAPVAMTLVPEPATTALWVGGLLALAGLRRVRR